MIRRKRYDDLRSHLRKREHTILIGARQTGKSTLLAQVAETLAAEGETVVSLNLERKEILLDLNQSPDNLFRYIPQNRPQRVYVLIDEIQYLSDPTNFLKLLYDEYADWLKVVATGSSAFYIDRQFRDSLAGRKRIFDLQTLDFEEFLLFKNQENLAGELRLLRAGDLQKSVLEVQLWTALEEYMTYGGYPAVVLEPNEADKQERLRELRDSFVNRDILEAGITDETKFYRLLILLASQTGNLLNTNELATTLRLTHATTDEYLYVLQKCFHISLVRPFFQNLRKELIKMPKVYLNDLGLRNVLINYFAPLEQRADKGALLENYVYRRLTEQYPNDQVKFWRTADGNEVDFVVEETGLGGKAIEVKFSATEASPTKYRKFTETYPAFPLQFYTWRDMNLLL
ncbi:ATP-binding protein [Nibrella viscosa]|uniref:ATP-binding protein n=1 Tax=Nibrella viscosa TaxID=1084524 RepID=UPI0031E52732